MKRYISTLCISAAAVLAGASAYAQDIAYTGTLVDSNDEPLIGATVKVPGTKLYAVTDLDGKFTINVPKGKSIEIILLTFI